jgi:hypothetical protein
MIGCRRSIKFSLAVMIATLVASAQSISVCAEDLALKEATSNLGWLAIKAGGPGLVLGVVCGEESIVQGSSAGLRSSLRARGHMLLIVMQFFLFLFPSPAVARDYGQWSDQSTLACQWSSMQPDSPGQSCCGEANAFQADDFEASGGQCVAIITDIIPNGWRAKVPDRARWKRDQLEE